MVKILEDMRVSEDWFFKLQSEELENLRGITASAFGIARFLSHHNIGDPIALHRFFRQCRLLQLDYRTDPFLRSVIEAIILRELRLLKHKARIPVKEGMTLFGIVDETGLLEQNEVYVTFDTTKGRHLPPPGPGRLLHRNCIIFSQKGKRYLPSQLSGGDLDGDLYIIWDPEVQPTRTFEPADYPRVEPVNIGRTVEVDDVADFFVDFMRTDHLGVIATRRMILADQVDEGTRHQELPKANNYRPDLYATLAMTPGPQTHTHKTDIQLDKYVVQPAYDEDEDSEPRRKYYRPDKLLGKLYRAVDERKIWSEKVQFRRIQGRGSFWDEFVRSASNRCEAIGPIMWIHGREHAGRIGAAYEDAISSAMYTYSEHPVYPITEFEVFLGYLTNKAGVQTNRQRDRSIKLKDEFGRVAGWIMGLIRRDHSRPLTGYEQEFDSLELCHACVHVGGEDKQSRARSKRGGDRKMESFRVVAACALLAELEYYEKALKGGGFVGVQPGWEHLPNGVDELGKLTSVLAIWLCALICTRPDCQADELWYILMIMIMTAESDSSLS
ncbi:hypothetical protein PHISP_00142 [Aspergillus sp. HF37]|nr:hypothetical protein PHISP_00142 [Aspergillus sp. HF37]